MNRHAIDLPQTAPFRYVDAVRELDTAGRRACLSLELDGGPARFGGARAMPGWLLIEAMAQACGVLLRGVTVGDTNGGLLVGVDQARLPDEVPYPARLDVTVALQPGSRPPFFNFDARIARAAGSAGGEIASAQLQVVTQRTFG